MQVNLSKSAIMIFRRGGRIAEKEKWFFHGEVIPITKEYNYLGVKLTSKLSFKQHIENRNVLAKNSINATWCTFLSKNKIKLSAKWKLFLAVTRAIQSYAAQVWGNSLFDEVDKIQLYFLKRVLHLPSNTPSYCILLETNVPSFHLYTLQLHLKYIFKTLFEYDDNRLPHILSKKILEKQIFWVEEISNLAQKLNITCNWGTSNKREWNRNIISIIENLHDSNIRTLWERAHQSTRLYKELDHNNARSYLNDNTGIYKIMWIMKARCDLIYLGSQRDLNCTLCNLNELEDITHFLGKCPILKRIRQRFFGKYSLNRDEIIDILNGVGPSGYNNLFKFITGAIEYRKLILSEFNT